MQELLAFRRCDYRQRVQAETKTGNIPPTDRIGILGNDNVKDYPPYLDYPKPCKPKTNADRFRSMTDEELAELFADNDCGYCQIHDFCFAKECQINCEDAWLEWLKKEAEGG